MASPRHPATKSPAGDERRVAARQKTYVEAWADPGGTSAPVICKVLDISLTGARMAAPSVTLPDDFTLRIGASRHAAKVVWRSNTEIGVEFQNATSDAFKTNAGLPRSQTAR
jgi:hypothetical protein